MASGPSTPWRHQTSKWFVGVAQKAHIRSTVQVILSDTETTSRGVLCLAPIGRLACMTTRLSRSCCSALRSIRRSKNVSERCIKKLPTRTAASFDTMRLGQSDPSRPATRLPVARGLALFLHTFCLRNLSIGFRGFGAFVSAAQNRVSQEQRLVLAETWFECGRHWIKVKNPAAPAVKREAEEHWR
jgi:hypothetical protein